MVNFNGISNKIKRVMGEEKDRINKAIDEFDTPVPKPVEKRTHVTLFKKPVILANFYRIFLTFVKAR
jgi:hypothetical protein